jgi:serine/threonine kinase 16
MPNKVTKGGRRRNTTMTSTLTRALQRLVNHLISLVRSFIAYLLSWWTRASQKPLLLDTGRRVYVGRKLAEGGFSYAFEAFDADDSGRRGAGAAGGYVHPPYVLKRIHGDAEVLEACRTEAHVHRSLPQHPNVMPLLGVLMTPTHACLLFPYCPKSLRSEVLRRVDQICARGADPNSPLRSKPPTSSSRSSSSSSNAPPPPWPELELLLLFREVLSGVRVMHDRQLSHRDIKLDNVLLSPSSHAASSSCGTPVLMDFGSAGPLVESVATRREQLEIVERASQHTTVSYRPPELFEGGVRVGDQVDFGKVDVYGLACTLFAAAYGQGASPSECEFVRDFSASRHGAVVKVVECTHLKVLAGLPSNPPPWYSDGLWRLLRDMMQQDPKQRPSLSAVIEGVEDLIQLAGGSGNVNDDRQFARRPGDNNDDEEDIELANRFI